ncbi:polymorphic membrane protein [Histomonas meleagridis]|uniref:polymorphic membrane protein n=1 Tax=Histomonas meleagridis TaxID=135588 RepID=UPI00355A0FF1|nr:polymorphic membrane protein [Histomonas meleagridis]KAH0806233.1 polymorphic membrane protein [Histomonas meleagridis]
MISSSVDKKRHFLNQMLPLFQALAFSFHIIDTSNNQEGLLDGFTYTGPNNDRKFKNSVIIVNNSSFINCISLGDGLYNSSGGAILIENGQLKTTNCRFESNYATIGGAIALFLSDYVSEDSNYTNNTALLFGGSIATYTNNPLDSEKSEPQESVNKFLQISRCSFTDSHSDYSGGAIYLSHIYSVIMISILFKNCSSSVAGGACMLNHSSIQFFTSQFHDNSCNYDNKTASNAFGGGSIMSLFDPYVNTTSANDLYFQNCCFTLNSCLNGNGDDILVVGSTKISIFFTAFDKSQENSIQTSSECGYCKEHPNSCKVQAYLQDTAFEVSERAEDKYENCAYIPVIEKTPSDAYIQISTLFSASEAEVKERLSKKTNPFVIGALSVVGVLVVVIIALEVYIHLKKWMTSRDEAKIEGGGEELETPMLASPENL